MDNFAFKAVLFTIERKMVLSRDEKEKMVLLLQKQFRAEEERAKKHEQFRICREIWIELLRQNRLIHEWPLVDEPDYKMLKRYMDSLKNDLDYFVFFVEKGEINEPDILEYYLKRVDDVDKNIKLISKGVSGMEGWDETKEVLALINKYKELTWNLRPRP